MLREPRLDLADTSASVAGGFVDDTGEAAISIVI